MLIVDSDVRRTIYNLIKDKYATYADVPEAASFPYVVIGESTTTDYSTKTQQGEEMLLNIHVFSDYRGYKEIAEMVNEIVTLVELRTIDISEKQMMMKIESVEFSDEQLCKHAVIKLQIRII